jgi:hypothetical protein
MKKIAIILLSLCLVAGCDLFPKSNPFVGTWIGHGELTQQNTPGAGQTQVTTIDDIIEFRTDMTFSIRQGFRQTVNGAITASLFQVGTGKYSYSDTTITMTFDATSDPGLNNDTPAYSFSTDRKTCTIQPTSLTFPLILDKAG